MRFIVSSAALRLVRRFSILASLLLLPAAMLAADYTVTAASPENINFAGVNLQPGDTIHLAAHTRAKLVLENITQGTPDNPIIITNTGGQFIIDNTTSDKGLHFYNCRNIVVRGTPSPGNYDYGIKIARVSVGGGIGMAFIQGSTDFEVTNVEIAHTGFAGLMAKSDNLKASSGFVMRNVRIHGLYIHDVGAEAIYVGSAFFHVTDPANPNFDPHEIHNVRIYNNTIENAGWDGIQLGCATQGLNAIHDNRIVGYGLLVGADASQDEGIRSNPGTAADIYNNWIEGSPTTSGTGIFANPYNSVKYYNNVIVTPEESGIFIGQTSAARGYVAGYSVKVFNNTIIAPVFYGIDLNNLSQSSGNLVQNTFTVAPGVGDVFLNNTAATASHNLLVPTVAAAGFVDASLGNYGLTAASPAVDAGLDLSTLGLVADIDGVTRPVGSAPDAGAYEHAVFGPGAPVITSQPAGRLVTAGGSVVFSVGVTGDSPLAYQWRKNGLPLAGATGATLSLAAVQAADAAVHSVTVANAAGSVTSDGASLLVEAVLPPVITTQPADQTVVAGGGVTFSVAASGTAPFSYQWLKDGQPVAGATSASLVLTNLQAADAGSYSVTVSNAGGTQTSNAATLTVIAPPSNPTNFAAATIVSDATVAGPVNPANAFTHALNIGANTTITVNGVPFGFGTGNGGGAQPAKNYTFSTFNNTSATFASSATGDIRTLLATRSTHTNSASYSLTLSGLTPGRRYGFALFTDSAHGVGRNWYRVGQNVDATTFDVDFSAAGAGTSRMLTATYTATAASITFTLTRLDGVGTTNNTGWVGFAGFVNHELAEPPQITTAPVAQSAAAGAAITFTVTATGTAPLAYQWLKDGQPLAGATAPTLTLHNVQPPDAGSYSVTVTNAGGSVTSAPAALTVNGTLFTAGTIVSDATVAPHLNPAYTYTHAININASATVTVNGVDFGFGTGNGGGSQAAKGYVFSAFNNAVTNFNSTATGQIRNVLASRATNTNSVAYTLTLSGLTPGTSYTLALFTDSSHGPGRNWYRVATNADAASFNVDFSAGGVSSSRVTTVTYTPPAASVTFTFTRLDGMGSPGVTNSTSWVGFAGFVNYALPAAPTVIIPPASRTVDAGCEAVFAVAARGDTPLNYQWLHNGVTIPGATLSSLVLANVTLEQAGAYAVIVTNPAGAATSSEATLTVNALTPPVLTLSPGDRSVEEGTATTFAAAATGTAPLSYQWAKEGVAIPGATAANFTLAAVQFADAGSYTVTVSNPVDSVTSAPAILTVTSPPPVAPSITTHPASRVTDLNLSTTFTVSATGTAPLAYQWAKDGTDIPGANSATLFLGAVQPYDAGSYTVTVSNAVGPVTSNPATLTVNVPRQTAQRATVAGQFDFNYLLYLPDGYDPASGPEWPLLVFLHGYGERSAPEANPMDPVHLNKLRTLGPPKRIEEGTAFPFIVVSPQCSGDWWSGAQLEQFITELAQRYRVDRTRIMLTGLSMGGFGVYDLAQRNPSRYAAIAPMSAAPQLDAGNLAAAPRLRDLPLWAFHGANDPLYSVADLQGYLDVIRAAGGEPLVTIYTTPPGNGHNAWVPAYNNDELYTWLLGHTAQPPVITTPPQTASAVLGSGITFAVETSGRWPFTYQWTKDGAPLPGATAQTLALANVQFPDAGEYAVIVSNGVGSVTSPPAGLVVEKIPATITLQNLAQTYDGLPKVVAVTTTPADLPVALTYAGEPGAPVNAGSYVVEATINDTNYQGSTTGTLVVSKAEATLLLGDLEHTYDGTPKGASFSTDPAALAVVLTYAGGPDQPVNAGSYPVTATIVDPNFSGTAAGSLIIERATPAIAWTAPAAITYGTPLGAAQLNATASVAGSFAYSPVPGTVLAAGANQPLGVTFTPLDAVNFNFATAATTIEVLPATASVVLSGLGQIYDGQPKPVTATTTPAGLPVMLTYNEAAAAPTLPGRYAVLAVVDDPNHVGFAEGELEITLAALVRHAPAIDGGVDGSVQLLLGENTTLNGSAWISGDVLVPGTPVLRLNGQPVFGGSFENAGAVAPSNYTITLNGQALLGRLGRRTDPSVLPAVAAPAAPAGTMNVTLNNPGHPAVNWATVRNLTLNGNVGQVAVPPGTYGTLAANGGNRFLLGISGAEEPAVYELQGLVLNSSAELRLAGPVVLTLASGAALSGSAGSAEHPEWLTLRIAAGGLTLNGNAGFHGRVIAPAGTVIINNNSTLTGTVASDRLTINDGGRLEHSPEAL